MLRRQKLPFRICISSTTKTNKFLLSSSFSFPQIFIAHRFMFPHTRLPPDVEKIIPKHRERSLSDHSRLAAIGLPPSEPVSMLAQEIEVIIYRLSVLESGKTSDNPQWIPIQVISKQLTDEQLEQLDAYEGGGLKQLIERQLSERCVITQDSKTKAFRVRFVAIKPELIALISQCVTPAVLESGLYRDVSDFGVVSSRIPDQLKRWCEQNHGSIAKAIYAGFRRIPFLPWKMDRRKYEKMNPIRFSLKPEHPIVAKAMRENAQKVHTRAKQFFEMVHGSNAHFSNQPFQQFNKTFSGENQQQQQQKVNEKEKENENENDEDDEASKWVGSNKTFNNNNFAKTVLEIQREDNEATNNFFKNIATKKNVIERPFMGPDLTSDLPEAPQPLDGAYRNRFVQYENNVVVEFDHEKKRFKPSIPVEEEANEQQKQVDEQQVKNIEDEQQKQSADSYASISWSPTSQKRLAILEKVVATGSSNSNNILQQQLKEKENEMKRNAQVLAPSIAFGKNATERNAASNQEHTDYSPSLMTPFVPSFFVPLEKIEKELEPFGYTAEHFERYFGTTSKCFQIISLGGTFGSKPKKFVRMHGHNGDFDMTESLTVAAQKFPEYKILSSAEAVEPFLQVLQKETNSTPGQWVPLGKLLFLVGDEIVKKVIPTYITDEEVQKVKETAKNEQIFLAIKQAQELSPLLYFSQLLHLFNFSPADGGLICYTACAPKILEEMKNQNQNQQQKPTTNSSLLLNLDQFSTPIPVFVNHLTKGLWNQSVPITILESRLIPKPIMEHFKQFFPNWQSFVETHSSQFVLNPENGYLSLRAHLERQLIKASGSHEAELEFAKRNRSAKEVNCVRRRHAMETMPDHPLASTQGLADYLFFLLPENDWVTFYSFKAQIPKQALDFMPRKGLFQMVTRFPNHFKVFDLPASNRRFPARSQTVYETTPCISRTTFSPLPEGAITETNLTERQLMKFVCRIFINNGLFEQQRGILLDVMMKRIPFCARIELKKTEDMIKLLKRLPKHFVLMAAYSDNLEVRLVKKPEEEDFEVYADIPLSETGAHLFVGGKYMID